MPIVTIQVTREGTKPGAVSISPAQKAGHRSGRTWLHGPLNHAVRSGGRGRIGGTGATDGRGLAAALTLGADGVSMGTRFWATKEALISDAAKAKSLAATGDDTIRSSVYDVVNGRTWPTGYTGRVVENRFVSKWHGHEVDLARARADELKKVSGREARSGRKVR